MCAGRHDSLVYSAKRVFDVVGGFCFAKQAIDKNSGRTRTMTKEVLEAEVGEASCQEKTLQVPACLRFVDCWKAFVKTKDNTGQTKCIYCTRCPPREQALLESILVQLAGDQAEIGGAFRCSVVELSHYLWEESGKRESGNPSVRVRTPF